MLRGACFVLALVLTLVACAPPTPTPTMVASSRAVITPANVNRLTQQARLNTINVEQIAWSPDGRLLAVASAAGIYVYDAGTLAQVHDIYVGPKVRSVAFSPDGTLLASASFDNAVRLWRARDGALLHTIDGLRSDRYSAAWSYSVAFSPDGAILAAGGAAGAVELWGVR